MLCMATPSRAALGRTPGIQFVSKIEWWNPLLFWYNSPLLSDTNPKMSSTDNTALLAILAELQKLNGRISTLESAKPSAPAAAKAGKKERKMKEKSAEDKPKREPTSWLLFTGRVRDALRSNGYEKAALGKECQMFCASLKEENADLDSWSEGDILARRAAWTAPEVSKQKAAGKSWRKDKSGSAPASVVSGGDGDAEEGSEKPKKARKNPWEGLTPEQKAERIAKMKAGKEAKKAASEGASEDEAAPASPKAAPKKTEAAPASPKAAPKKAEAAPVSAPASASAGEFKPVMLNGTRYLVNLANGHSYLRLADGGQGEWAGIFSKTPKPHIDDTVPEPGAEAEEEEELNFDE
jgi:hypothetical protein